jgi:hypothetical protein
MIKNFTKNLKADILAKIKQNKEEYNPDDKWRKNLLDNIDRKEFELMDHIKKLAENPKLRRLPLEDKIAKEYLQQVQKYGHPP